MRKTNDVLDILKLKKVRNNEKLDLLLSYYDEYFSKSFIKDVEKETFSVHSEEFMKEERIDKVKYQECYKSCYMSKMYYHFTKMVKFVNELKKNGGIDINLISEREHKFLRQLLDINKKFNMDSSFDSLYFYYNQGFKAKLSEYIEKLVKETFIEKNEKAL